MPAKVPISELIKDVDAKDLLAFGIEITKNTGLPVSAWQSGEPLYAMLDIVAQIFAGMWNEGKLPFSLFGLYKYMTAQALDFAAQQIAGIERTEASFATGRVRLTNSNAAPYAISDQQYAVRSSVTGKTYRIRTSSPVVLPGWPGTGPKPSLELDITADEAGSGSSAAAGDITEIVSGLSDVECTNDAAVYGIDEQTDESLQAQATMQPWGDGTKHGPRRTRISIAQSTRRDDKTLIDITEVESYPPTGNGALSVFLCGPSGAVAGSDVALIQARIRSEADGEIGQTTCYSVTNVPVSVNATVYVDARFSGSTEGMKSKVEAAIAAHLVAVPTGGEKQLVTETTGWVYAANVLAAAKTADPRITFVEIDIEDIPITFTSTVAGKPVPGEINASVIAAGKGIP